MDLLSEALASTGAASPIVSHETMNTPIVLQSIGEPAKPSGPKPINEPIVYGSSYVTFPAYRKTTKSKANITNKCAKMGKNCLTTAGTGFLTSLQAAGEFYAHSEQEWDTEYQTFGRVISNSTSVLETIDAADNAAHLKKPQKHSRSSWAQKIQSYWKPEPATRPITSNLLSPNNEEAFNPPISSCLQKQNRQRPECMRSSHLTDHPLHHGRMPQRCERIPLIRQPRFSSPEERNCQPERQPRRAYRVYQLQKPQRIAVNSGEEEVWDEDEEENLLRTPWSGLEAITEEEYTGEQAWGTGDDEGIGGNDDDGMGCDGFEADGELCLRHKICAKEAMTLSGV